MTDKQAAYDLFIIGGGINGCGVANDAAGRGLKVYLCEQNDLASGTSSASSKLIHGGLRYLEHYEFRLVREALAEREVLLNIAPHLVEPLKFVLPHRPHLRPAWLIRCGLFLYDHLSKRNSLPSATSIDLGTEKGLKASIKRGFEYYDCWVDDARLVITNAIQAKQNGAVISTNMECLGATYNERERLWHIRCLNKLTNETVDVSARHIVNAAGPWLSKIFEQKVSQLKPSKQIRLIKGSHIVVPRVPNGDSAYILQNEDKRIVFVLPYQTNYSIIGTTDQEYLGDINKIEIDQSEIDYLLDVHNQHFIHQLGSQDIVSTYSGVRPLCNDESSDPSAITRDYTIDTQSIDGHSAFISIYGGKITTYRKLANAVMAQLQRYVPNLQEEWTERHPLIGNSKLGMTRQGITDHLTSHYPWLTSSLVRRYASSYGLLAENFLTGRESINELGQDFSNGLYQAEVDYLIKEEWARNAKDILLRRTKLGYQFSDSQEKTLRTYIQSYLNEPNITHLHSA